MSSMLRSLRFVQKINLAVSPRRLSSRRFGSSSFLTERKVQPGCCACIVPFQQRKNYVTNAAPKFEPVRARANAEFIFKDVDRQLNKYGKLYKEHVDDLLKAVFAAGSLTSTQALFLLRCCGNFLTIESLRNRRVITENIWRTIKEYDTQIDVSHYNAYILANLENETDFSPVSILKEMKEKNIEPNRVTFQRLIEQYCCKGDMEGATKILEYMNELTLPVNESIFNSLIKGHSESGDLPNALKMLDIMRKSGVEPTSKSYTAIICAHAKRGDIKSMQEVLKECQTNDISLTDRDIFEIIYKLAISNHPELVDEMLMIVPKGRSYLTEAITCVHRLIDKSHEDVAFKVQMSLEGSVDSDKNQSYYFVRKLVLSSQDVEKIAKYCKILGKENPNSLFSAAAYVAMTNNLHALALSLFRHWHKSGGEIREHFFFPIFVSCIRNNDLEGILNALKAMISEYKIYPQISVLRKFVAPYMVEQPAQNVTTLVNLGVPNYACCTAIVSQLLYEGKSRQADLLLSSRNTLCNLNVLINALGSSLAIHKDVKSFVNIVNHQCGLLSKSDPSVTTDLLAEEEGRMGQSQLCGNAILKALEELRDGKEDCLYEVLENFVHKGMRVDPDIGEKIKAKLKEENLNPSLIELVSKLTSADLPAQTTRESDTLSSKSVSNYQKSQQNSNSISYKLSLIQHHARLGNSDSLERLLKEVDEEKPIYHIGFCCSLVLYYSRMKDVNEADKWYKRLKSVDPQCRLEKTILINYADLLVSYERVDDAVHVLKGPTLDGDTDRYLLCSKLLWNVARCYPERIEEFFSILETGNFFQTYDRNLIAPLIKAPLKIGNIDQALKRATWAREKFNCIPHVGSVIVKLVEIEDSKSLQYVMDLSTQVHGETNALLNLVAALIECNKPRQARKILEGGEIKFTNQQLMRYASFFHKQGKTSAMETLYHISSGLIPNMDNFYMLMLKAYEEQDNWKKCLSLWTQLQEDNIQPSAEFMAYLEKILINANQKVPFARPEASDERKKTAFGVVLSPQKVIEMERDLEKLSVKERKHCILQLIQYYLEHADLKHALEYFHRLITLKQYDFTVQFSFPPVITKFVEIGDISVIIKAMKDIVNPLFKIDNQSRHNTKYLINDGFYEAGKYEQYLSYLDDNIIKSNGLDREFFSYLYDTKTAVKALLNNPQFEEYFEKFATNASKALLFGPMNSLWLCLILKGSPNDLEKAKDIWEKHLKSGLHLYTMDIIKSCKNMGALAKLPSIAEIISTSNLPQRHKIKSFEFMLKTLIASEEPRKYDIAYECLNHIAKSVDVHTIDPSLLEAIDENLGTVR
ncbi:hypothetical protein QAD02_009230 [Eretmocerus hayati]|uniref:Uncharacterized protein n=1 Tax=Eretmocerus hayati TaxID=131215 RepID=A0ACC2N912_9HYME|nr:hypothetical protein QAD02_009230 [Eretmocerus hayati]